MSLAATIAGAVAPRVFDVIEKGIDSSDKAKEFTHEIAEAAAAAVVAEAQGESWLQRNWRPMVMLWFSFLIGAYWFGFVPVGMPVSAVEGLFTLVQIGLGGYVIGRSGEKIAKTIAPVLRR